MGKRRHILPAALIAATVAAPQVGADTPGDPLRFFADCAGRFSAELSHRWMMSDPTADDIEALRAALLEIVASLTPDGAGREVLNWRLQARTAHSALLSRASFQDDGWAAERATAHINHCAAFLLGPTAPAPAEPNTPDIAATAAFAPAR
ncbi:MAG: hypothetical protein AAF689_14965 [Pseudomonadota bacterium]